MTSIDIVWTQLKEYAADRAARGDRLDRARAEAVVARMMRDAAVAPWPPSGVIDFYADELVSMCDRLTAR
jgi:hypothetical protein